MPSSNSHIYENCYDLANELITRETRRECQLVISDEWDYNAEAPLELLKLEHFNVESYEPHDSMKVQVN